MAVIIQSRHGTATRAAAVNPVLAVGEIGVVIEPGHPDDRKFKVGDGATAWNDIPFSGGGGTDATLGARVTALEEAGRLNTLFGYSTTGNVANTAARSSFASFAGNTGIDLDPGDLIACHATGIILNTTGAAATAIFYTQMDTTDVFVTDAISIASGGSHSFDLYSEVFVYDNTQPVVFSELTIADISAGSAGTIDGAAHAGIVTIPPRRSTRHYPALTVNTLPSIQMSVQLSVASTNLTVRRYKATQEISTV